MKYLKRQIDKELEAWKCSVEHKPLLVRGARQVVPLGIWENPSRISWK